MTTQLEITNSLSKMFITNILLTGSSKRAEVAMLQGIHSLDNDSEPGMELLFASIAAAVDGEFLLPEPRTEEIEEATSMLHVGLRPLLRLPANLRRCFVLRFVAAMPRETCARFLQITLAKVDEFSCAAVRELARLVEGEESACLTPLSYAKAS
jgi:hypothetical protein